MTPRLGTVLYGHNVTQRSVRAAARELRVAARHAGTDAAPRIEAILRTLEDLDEAISVAYAKDSDPTELFPERGIGDRTDDPADDQPTDAEGQA